VAVKILLASSNPGKLAEFQKLASGSSMPIEVGLMPNFEAIPPFDESAPTLAENSLGKALYYSQHSQELMLADDSGLVVPSLGGKPGVHSARYAGENATSGQRIEKLLEEMKGKKGDEREAHFVCALSLVRGNQALCVITAKANGEILESQRGTGGFGYDPIFFFLPLSKTFADLSVDEKNLHSHRGKAFRRLLEVLPGML
jgi:XTP/dITP diphosphohydrolase